VCGILHGLVESTQKPLMPWIRLFPLLACLGVLSSAHAYVVRDLYTATVPRVEGGTRANETAFAAALAVVLVKVSGQSEAPARLKAALGHARSYVQRYGVDAEGRLEVGFDPASIDRLLADADLPIWGRERPAMLVLANVESPDGTRAWLAADSTGPEREAIEEAAAMRGVPLVWPQLDAADRSALRPYAGGGGDPERLVDLAARYQADAVLVGDLIANDAGELTGSWALGFGERSGRRTGAPHTGIALAADEFASLYAASGGDLTVLEIEVSGIVDLASYAHTLDYLDELSLTEDVAVEEFAGDALRVRLTLRGDPATFERSIALDDRLVRSDSATVPGRMSFHFRP
jgi:hypothetical protein